jgi:hypothetical protein
LKPLSALARLKIRGWRVVSSGYRPEAIGVAQSQHAELGLADARCIFQYGVEHGLQFSARI